MNATQTTLNNLRAAIAGLENGEGPAPFIEGHGLQSRRFRFNWSDEALSIDFDLPCSCVLSDEESRREDDAAIGAACRMAVLLLYAQEAGTLLRDDEARLMVSCDRSGNHYAVLDARGEALDSGDDWSVLAARLEVAFGENASGVAVIWP